MISAPLVADDICFACDIALRAVIYTARMNKKEGLPLKTRQTLSLAVI